MFWALYFLNHKNITIEIIDATIKNAAIIPPTIPPTFVVFEDFTAIAGVGIYEGIDEKGGKHWHFGTLLQLVRRLFDKKLHVQKKRKM